MATLPRFRSDLTAAREEQQGVVFFRIDDPDTQTSFRLYEIEYLIAQQLDGQRDLSAVITAVKEEYNFDISEPDLKKFVSQLESMGFVSTGPAAPTPSEYGEDDPTTQIMPGEQLRERVGVTEEVDAAAQAAATVPLSAEHIAAASLDATQKVTSEDAIEARVAVEQMHAAPVAAATSVDSQGVDSQGVDSQEDGTIPFAMSAPTDFQALEAGVASSGPVEIPETGPEPILFDSIGEPAVTMDISGATAEHDRLLDSAVEYLLQGYVVHARDYFLAARENRRGDERIEKMVAALDEAGEEPDPDALQRLKGLGRELFPDAVGSTPAVGLLADDEPLPSQRTDEDDLKTRIVWSLVLVSILVVGVAGVWWAMKALRILEGTAKVATAELQAAPIPVYYADPAASVSPRREEWLVGPGPGKTVTVPEVGTKVEQGDVIIGLSLSPKVDKTLKRAEVAVDKARVQLEKSTLKLEALESEREQMEVARDEAQTRIKELKPGGIMDKSAKLEIDKYKKAKVRANKKLTQLAKKSRKLSAQKKKAETKHDAVVKRLASIRERTARKFLRAPYAGTVVQVEVQADQMLTGEEKAVLFRDHLAAKVVFEVKGKGNLLAGGQAQIRVGNGNPSAATVSGVEATQSGQKLEIELPDPGGAYAEMDPTSFRLVREIANPAFEIDSDSVVERDGQPPYIVLVFQNRAAYREVELLYRDADIAVVRPAAGNLGDGDKIVVASPGATVADLPEDMALEVE